jgi:cytochrome bd-type quinol oxidase subunit 2
MTNASPIGVVVLLTIMSVVLLALGLWLHRKGMLRSRAASLAWAIVTVVPVFVGGWVFTTQHDRAPIANGGVGATSSANPG